MDHWVLEADSKKELEAAITSHENTGWELIQLWVDGETYYALMEER